MAKHKKRGRKSKKELAEKKKSSSSFWRQVFAFVMIVVALLIMIGGFNSGGEGPKKIFAIFAKAFGFAAYFTPVMISYWAILKFKNEKHKVPLGRVVGGCLVLIAMSALFHVFVSKENSLNFANKGIYGGYVGYAVNSIFAGIFTSTTAFIVYSVFLLIAFLFTFSITPKNFFKFIASIFKLDDKEESKEQEDAKSIAGKTTSNNQPSKLSIHENVPIEHGQDNEKSKTPVKVASFRNTAQKLAPVENHEALTVRSDPNWKFPGLDLLNRTQDKADPGNIQQNADIIKETLANFNINVEMEGANVGPRVTQFTLKPPNGVKLQKITALDSNIALDLAAQSIRIEAPIPGKRAVGVEIPNLRAATVRMASVIDSNEWRGMKNPLGFAIGKDITGQSVVGAIDKMPHLLIAGQTGSGKSVMINVLLTSLLYKCSPADLKLILVDPKQVELKPYEDIPHLLTPVITEPEKCISALKWAVAEMERRLRTMAEKGKRDIKQYNEAFAADGEGMPYIVIVIDELSDLMMMAARDVEALVVRIAQKARAAGIHLVLATQRPSVNVITGLIKANVPGRIAFTTQSRVDSATILDSIGAEKLLGMGDMLLKTSEMPQPIRIQGALITESETMKVTDFLRQQQPPNYDDEVVSQSVTLNGKGGIVADSGNDSVDDSAWHDAIRVVIESQKASTSYLQRRLRIGYGRAARLIETMEEQGIVGPADGSKPREVLIRSMDDLAGPSEVAPVSENEPDDVVPVNVRFD